MRSQSFELDIPLGETDAPRFQLTLPVFFPPEFDERAATYLRLSEYMASGIYVSERFQDRWKVSGPYSFAYSYDSFLKIEPVDHKRDLQAGEIFQYFGDEAFARPMDACFVGKFNPSENVRIQLLLPATLLLHSEFASTTFMSLSGESLIPGIYISEQFGDQWELTEESFLSAKDGFRTVLIEPVHTTRSLFAKEKLCLVQAMSAANLSEQSLLSLISQSAKNGQKTVVVRIISPAFFVDASHEPIPGIEHALTTFILLTAHTLVPGIYVSEQFGDQWTLHEPEEGNSSFASHDGYRNYKKVIIKPIGEPRNVYSGEIMSLFKPE